MGQAEMVMAYDGRPAAGQRTRPRPRPQPFAFLNFSGWEDGFKKKGPCGEGDYFRVEGWIFKKGASRDGDDISQLPIRI